MGNLSSICIDKGGSPDLETLFEVKDDKTFDCEIHQSYASCVHLWRFSAEENDDSRIADSPIRLVSFDKFNSKECYAALHIFNKQYTPSNAPPAPTPSGKTANSLASVLSSSEEALTPKGLALPFGYVPLEPFTVVSNKTLRHTLYLWHGRDAGDLTRAVALGKVLAMDKLLSSEEKALRLLFSDTQKLPLSDVFSNDTGNGKSFDWHHLFYFSDIAYGSRVHASEPEKISLPKLDNITPLRTLPECNGSGNTTPDSNTSISAKKSPVPGLALPARPSSGFSNSTMPALPAIPSLALPPRDGVTAAVKPKFSLTLPATKSGGMVPPISLGETKISALPLKHSDLDKANSDKATDYTESTGVTEKARKEEKLAFYDKVCSQITPNMFLGSQTIAMDKDELQRNGVTHILNCAGAVCDNYHPNTFQYKTLYLGDGYQEDINCMFYEVIEFIDNAIKDNGKVFVHCQQGVSRSSAMLISYLMWRDRTDYNTTHLAVKAKRGVSNPNTGFMWQLVAWWKRLTKVDTKPKLYRIIPHCKQTPNFVVMKLVDNYKPTSLDPRGAFLFHLPDVLYLWVGKDCKPVLEDRALIWADRLSRFEGAPQYTRISQGEEPLAFWQAFDPNATGPKGEIVPVRAYDNDYALVDFITSTNPSSLLVSSSTPSLSSSSTSSSSSQPLSSSLSMASCS